MRQGKGCINLHACLSEYYPRKLFVSAAKMINQAMNIIGINQEPHTRSSCKAKKKKRLIFASLFSLRVKSNQKY
jgi:hypothetical protein